LDETDASVFGVVTEDLMSSLKMEAARCAEKLSSKLHYIPEEWTLRNITYLSRRFGISSSFTSALKIAIFQILYCPTNALNYINYRVIKNTLKYKIYSNMFRFTQEPSSGSQIQCLAKITGMVPLCLSI